MPIPASGLFRLYCQASQVGIVSGNFETTTVGAPPPIATAAQIGAVLNDGSAADAVSLHQSNLIGGIYTPSTGVYELSFFPDTTQVIFDVSGTPTSIDFLSADFPIGVLFNQTRVWLVGSVNRSDYLKRISNWKLKARGSVVLDTNVADTVGTTALLDFSSQFVTALVTWGPNQMFGSTFGLQVTVEASLNNPQVLIPNFRTDLIYIEGVYNLAFFNFTTAPQNAGPGGEITITDANAHLDLFTSFKVKWSDGDEYIEVDVPSNFILTHTNTTLIMRIPFHNNVRDILVPYGGRRLAIFGISNSVITAVGEVQIANINILLVDGSGVYTLVPGKTNDTYYDRSVSPVATLDLKIPDPFIRTGFVKS